MKPSRTATAATFFLLLATGPASTGAQQVAELPAEDRTIRPELETLYGVGALEGAAWEIFGDLNRVAFDADGNLYVFDRDNYRVVVVSDEGEFVREFGKEGEGPNEWRRPVNMAVLPDGRVVVADMGHRAALVHEPDGTVSGRIPLGTGSTISVGTLQADPRGGAVIEGGSSFASFSIQRGGEGGSEMPETRAIERWELGSEGTRAVLYEAWKPPAEAEPTTLSGGGVRFRIGMAGPKVFEPGLHTGALPDGGVAVVDSSTWKVKIVGADGAVRRVLRRPFRPTPVTDRVKEAEKERRLEELEAGEGPQMQISVSGSGTSPVSQDQIREMMRNRIEGLRFYEEIPVISQMRSGWGSTLWIRRAGDEVGEAGPIDVVTAEGEYLGTIPAGHLDMPTAFGPDGRVAYIERDEFDVATVVVKRLPPQLR